MQFTRNPDGIGGALRKIAGLSRETGLGSRIDHPQAESLSHLFLGAARSNFARGLFATHPPLEERLRRIYGHAIEALPAPENAVALALGGLQSSSPAHAEPTIEYVPATRPATAAAIERLPASSSPVAALVHAGSTAAPGVALAVADHVTADIGTVRPRQSDFALDTAQRALLDALRRAAVDSTRAQLLVLALLVDKERTLREQQRTLIAEAYGAEAAQIVDAEHERIQRLPPGARQPLADVAMPALRRLPREARAALLRTAHLLVVADGRVTVREFLLFSILKRRLGPEASRPVAVKFDSLLPLAAEAGLALSLVAAVRLPERPEHAFNAGLLLLRGIDPAFVPAAAVRLDDVSAALARLNELAPLVKPQLIKAATAVAFVDDETNWQAASTLRMICAALDAPLPPQVLQAEAG